MDILQSVQDLLGGVISPSMLLVFLAVFVFCYTFLAKTDLPPGPLKLPVIGNVWWLVEKKRKHKRIPVEVYKAWKKYGDVIHVTIGSNNIIFLCGYDTIQEAFVKRSEDFSSRPYWMVKEFRNETGIVFENGKRFKAIRRFTLLALRDFGVGKTSLEEKILKEADAATEYFLGYNGAPTGTGYLTARIIANVIYGIVFGERCEYSGRTMKDMLHNLDTLFHEGSPIDGSGALMPEVFRKLMGRKQSSQTKNETKLAFKWIYAHVIEHIDAHKKTFDTNDIRDFIDLFIQKEEEGTEKELFTLSTLFGVIVDLFVAGSETTSNSLNWCILYMQEYPDVQKKCQDEIQQQFGYKPVGWSDRSSLPYVEATLLEIQRMSNIAEMSLPHTNEVETTFRGYRIPKDSVIHASLLSSNMDPKYWQDPHTFNPDRHIVEGKLHKNPALIPFSIGPRMCLGDTLARMELFLILTTLLQRFTFHREDPNVKHSFDSIQGQVTSAPLPYKTRAIARQ